MQYKLGLLFPISITALHFVNDAPNSLYSSILADRLSRPSVIFSFSEPSSFFAPASTLIPASIPLL